MKNEFIWCDLSTFRPDVAAQFYRDVLGWEMDDASDGYRNAFSGGSPVAAIYEMPPFFRKINMPSFWMSYIRVESVVAVVESASKAGGKIELEEDFGDGKIALIRDSLGAGFTVYEGGMLSGLTGGTHRGSRVGHTLRISSRSAVETFYGTVFGWQMMPEGDGHWSLSNSAGDPMARLVESSDAERGGFEYWEIAFAVDDLRATGRLIEKQGGTVFGETQFDTRKALSVADMDGAAFCITATLSA